ncbi:hypothetical protein Cni_G08502 [Canna indica]|uniref:Uncharacterized protein n=1 Tax=Canna indica TaxID=4628 RepID=A0AAQ3Q800_9LILI|nr:hypothetical protein Cni_G08502 [Canna indica]
MDLGPSRSASWGNNSMDVGGVADQEDRDRDGEGSRDDEGAAVAEGAGAAIAHVANEGLDDEIGERSAEPHQARPLVLRLGFTSSPLSSSTH